MFAHGGVPLVKVDNARVSGWQRVREYLAEADDGLPRLQIFRCCENLIRTLPMLFFDEHFVEDVSGRCEDHCAGGAALRADVETVCGERAEETKDAQHMTRLQFTNCMRTDLMGL
ncbi:MAG: hypothetical protein R2912_10110 [Eubacteriales bacterium]